MNASIYSTGALSYVTADNTGVTGDNTGVTGDNTGVTDGVTDDNTDGVLSKHLKIMVRLTN